MRNAGARLHVPGGLQSVGSSGQEKEGGRQTLDIDIGGTGIKGTPEDTETGELLAARFRSLSLSPSKPKVVSRMVGEIARHCDWHAPAWCGFPGVMREGLTLTAANVHKSWIGTNTADLFASHTGCPVWVLNDADAAELTEITFGAGKGNSGIATRRVSTVLYGLHAFRF
jgi:polyphosphate glucokinase